ncbi:hypothetical protein A0H81_00064 [Grifola frondosa]|uniref:Uncharacterized protein n=1 Tax=Grifola frondosa TaxID=5627 RepID=A0A1C7MP93_GRIFR|nr:hypothetical protein A0H81_00064 [Grifola frondosa]
MSTARPCTDNAETDRSTLDVVSNVHRTSHDSVQEHFTLSHHTSGQYFVDHGDCLHALYYMKQDNDEREHEGCERGVRARGGEHERGRAETVGFGRIAIVVVYSGLA